MKKKDLKSLFIMKNRITKILSDYEKWKKETDAIRWEVASCIGYQEYSDIK